MGKESAGLFVEMNQLPLPFSLHFEVGGRTPLDFPAKGVTSEANVEDQTPTPHLLTNW